MSSTPYFSSQAISTRLFHPAFAIHAFSFLQHLRTAWPLVLPGSLRLSSSDAPTAAWPTRNGESKSTTVNWRRFGISAFRERILVSVITQQSYTLPRKRRPSSSPNYLWKSVTVWSISCLTCSGTSPLVRRCCLFCTSAVYSYPRIHTVRSFTQYNLSSILQIFLHMRVSTPRQNPTTHLFVCILRP
jgi:hypothetical protein